MADDAQQPSGLPFCRRIYPCRDGVSPSQYERAGYRMEGQLRRVVI